MSVFDRESESNSAALNRLIRERQKQQGETIHRTYNPECPACVDYRQHTDEEWKNHPDAGHGFTPETGWTKPGMKEAPRSGGRT